jgi:hypothetical protein
MRPAFGEILTNGVLQLTCRESSPTTYVFIIELSSMNLPSRATVDHDKLCAANMLKPSMITRIANNVTIILLKSFLPKTSSFVSSLAFEYMLGLS